MTNALILICPGFFPRVATLWHQRVAVAALRLVKPHALFPIPLNDPDLFTATPAWQEFIRSDPLSLREATARLLVENVRLDGYLRWRRPQLRIPLLVLLAGRDRIIDNDRTRRWVGGLTNNMQLLEYPDAHHTLEFEPDPDIFIDALKSWLERTLCARVD
jgi:alpha-beta hydrolase superfamily lysophospholipase